MKVLEFLEEKGYEVVLLGLRGSSHFGLNMEDSDLDYSAIVVPKIHDLFFKEASFKATEYQIDDLHSVQVMSLQGLLQSMKKVTINLVEYFSKIVYIDENFKPLKDLIVEFLLTSKEAESLFKKNLFFTYCYKIVAKELTPKELAKFDFYYNLLQEDSTIGVFFEDKVPEYRVEEYKRIKKSESYSLQKPLEYYQEVCGKLFITMKSQSSSIEVPSNIVEELTTLIFQYLYKQDPKLLLKFE